MARKKSGEQPQQSDVTVVTSKSRPSWLSKRAVLPVAVVLVIVVGGFGWWLIAHNHKPALTTDTTADNLTYNTLINEQNLLSANANYDQAASDWIAYAATTPSKAHKESAYINAADLYMSNSQYTQAVNLCKKYEALAGVTFEEAELAARAYTALGNKQEAIHYYQEAIRLLPASLSNPAAEKASFQGAIQELQGGS